MEIYFDNVLINEDYYTSLSTSFALFNDTFYLGSTASNTYNLSVAKEAVSKQPNIVTVKDNGALIATLVVDKLEENDFEYKYTLTDKIVNLEFEYDASQIFTNGSATLLEIAQDICNKAGVTLATTNFRSYDKKISWYDNTRTAREYIGFIAELNGGYAQIGKDGKLYFLKQKTSSVKTINFDECEDFKIGEKHKITRVVYELGALKYEYGDETGNTLYLNGENVYITEQSEVEAIYNEIKGFEFYSFSTGNCPIDYKIMAGQVISFTDGTNKYPTIVGYNLTYNGGWYGGYELNVATKKQEETQVVGTDKKIKNLSIKVDRDKNEIITKIESVEGQVTDITTTQATKEGTEIKIDDGAEESIIKLEVDGKSEQETRSGKNLYNNADIVATSDASIIKSSTGFTATRTSNSTGDLFVGSYEKQLKPNTTYTFYENRTNSSTCYFYSDNLFGTALTRNIAKSTDTLVIYTFTTDSTGKVVIGFYSASQTQGDTVTLSNIMLLEGQYSFENIPEYEPYGASPSPEFPSEIQSVGDDVNLFNKVDVPEKDINGLNWKYDNTTDKVNISGVATSTYSQTTFINLNLEPDTYYFKSFGDTKLKYNMWFFNSNSELIGNTKLNNPVIITENVTKVELFVEGLTVGESYSENMNFKVIKGTVATPYSEYGKGTVEIKQRNKNLLKGLSTPLDDTNYWHTTTPPYFTPLEDGWGKFEYDNTNGTGTVFINAKVKKSAVDLKENKTYTVVTEIRNSSISESSGTFLQVISSNTAVASNIARSLGYSFINAGGTYKALIQTKESFSGVEIAIDTYLRLSAGTKGTVEARISLIEGDIDITDFKYEPHKSNNYVIPLSQPLRSLPNGVKDTIEEDGIHRRIRTIELKISDMDRSDNYPGWSNVPFLNEDYSGFNSPTFPTNIISNIGGNKTYFGINTNGTSSILLLNKGSWGLTQSQWKEQYPDLVLQLQYELAEEVIEPFDEEQQAVIDSIETNLYTQYFTCDANMRITYVRNNGLSDTYATIMKLTSEVTQTKDAILSTVSKTLEEYDTTEEVNSKIEQKADSITSTVSQTYATKSEYEDEMNEQNQKISKVTQTVDELNSKIQDIADITTFGESMYAKVELDAINESEPIQITVKPTVENISYLYPHENLYPSDDLYLKDRKIRFTNKTNDTYIDYVLPDDLLIAPDGTYDEFYLGYDEQVCQITKRCKYNADGTVSKLDSEQITSYDYPKIELKDGDYTIELLGYTNAYLTVRLMAQNIYTTQFATKAEVKSEIAQKADEVNISVDKKLSNYSTTTQMNSAINVKANEITSNVSTTYATKGELNTTKSEIKQTTDSISSIVSKKVGNDEIISKINQSAESVGINAKKIELSAEDVLNLIAGNAINLTSKNIIITSDFLEITKNGKMKLKGNVQATDLLRVENINGNDFSYFAPDSWGIVRNNGSIYATAQGGNFANSNIELSGTNGTTNVRNTGITTPKVTQTSLATEKKNFEKYTDSALDKIKNIDIYKYNLKSEEDTDKKHIGFVIGKDYKYSKEVTSTDNQGVDNYSFTSLCCKAIQEQQELIEQLQNEIKELKGEK